MQKGVALFLIAISLIPLAYSISIRELISKYVFSTSTSQMNVTNYADFMFDKDNNGQNDTLAFELSTINARGNFLFVVNLVDKNGVLTNETNVTLSSGVNKINLTFDSILLSQNQFNYSIKIYNSSRNLKYRRDNIPTQPYSNYKEGLGLLGIRDLKIGEKLQINATINSSVNGTFESALFLKYNNSIISAKNNFSIINSVNYLAFDFGNETMKRTHYAGAFNVSSIKIGKKTIKTNFATSFYDFKDFADSSYFSNFADSGIDTNSNGKYDNLQINSILQILKNDDYSLKLELYDLFGNIVEIKNISIHLNSGMEMIPFYFNGSRIYSKKLNGPFIVKNIKLYENGILIDNINDAYITNYYNFNDFESPSLPDIKSDILVSGEYHYGTNNVSANFTFKNIGNRHAFNVFTEMSDNNTFSKSNKSSLLMPGSQIVYQVKFVNISDIELGAIADAQNLIEELNESNNGKNITVRINKKPNLSPVNNTIVNGGGIIIINLSSFDPDNDYLSFSINFSKFIQNKNLFTWNTTENDNGSYVLNATASDGYLSDSSVFEVRVLNAIKNDLDNDGIEDSVDSLIGDKNSVNTTTINLSVVIGNSRNLSQIFAGNLPVRFFDNNLPIVDFNFNFSSSKLNLTSLMVNKQSGNSNGSFIINGLKMPQNKTKTVYVDRANSKLTSVCIKDAQMSNINEISSRCNSQNEFKISCSGKLQKSYRCTYNSTIKKYKVQGLNNSGVVQI